MTVSSETAKKSFIGNGSTTRFTINFYFLDATHLSVVRTDTLTQTTTTLTLGTHYTILGAGVSTGGTLVMKQAPTANQMITVSRSVPFTQLTHYVEGDPFPAASHESALDLAVMREQQLKETQDRTLRLPTSVLSIVNVEVPLPIPNTALAWNEVGTALTNIPVVGQEIPTYLISQIAEEVTPQVTESVTSTFADPTGATHIGYQLEYENTVQTTVKAKDRKSTRLN